MSSFLISNGSNKRRGNDLRFRIDLSFISVVSYSDGYVADECMIGRRDAHTMCIPPAAFIKCSILRINVIIFHIKRLQSYMHLKWKLLATLLLASGALAPLMARAQEAYLTDGTTTIIATSSQGDLYMYMNQEASSSEESSDSAAASTNTKGFLARFFNWFGGLF